MRFGREIEAINDSHSRRLEVQGVDMDRGRPTFQELLAHLDSELNAVPVVSFVHHTEWKAYGILSK